MVLDPVYIATQKLQAEQLYFGDFYKLWLEMKLTVQAMNFANSTILADCLEKRENSLLNNEIIVSAIYLDPRLQKILLKTPILLMKARNHLKRLIRQIYIVSQNVRTILIYFLYLQTHLKF